MPRFPISHLLLQFTFPHDVKRVRYYTRTYGISHHFTRGENDQKMAHLGREFDVPYRRLRARHPQSQYNRPPQDRSRGFAWHKVPLATYTPCITRIKKNSKPNLSTQGRSRTRAWKELDLWTDSFHDSSIRNVIMPKSVVLFSNIPINSSHIPPPGGFVR